MNYGEALLHGIRGTVHAHAWLLDHPVFNIVQRFVKRALPMRSPPRWEVFARLADPIDGQTLSCQSVCPHCGSDERSASGKDRAIGNIELPDATFHGFLAMSPEEKLAQIRKHELDIVPPFDSCDA